MGVMRYKGYELIESRWNNLPKMAATICDTWRFKPESSAVLSVRAFSACSARLTRVAFSSAQVFRSASKSSSASLAQQYWTQIWCWPFGSQFPASSGGSSDQRYQLQVSCKQPAQFPGYNMNSYYANLKSQALSKQRHLALGG